MLFLFYFTETTPKELPPFENSGHISSANAQYRGNSSNLLHKMLKIKFPLDCSSLSKEGMGK
jgi:hypothetical protein